jgi:hypothetical protein
VGRTALCLAAGIDCVSFPQKFSGSNSINDSLNICWKAFAATWWAAMTDLNHQDPVQGSRTGSFPHAVVGENPLDEPPQSQQLSSASSYADLNYLFGVQDQAMIAPKSNRNRRKSSQGAEHTKHRRTRSGCYTCRSRRVKVYMQFSSN